MMPDDAGTRGKCTAHAEKIDVREVRRIVEKYGGDRAALVSMLGEIQAKYRYLPADALRIVADTTGCSLVDVYGAATFYRSFSLKPRGKHLISVCLGTACHVRGAPSVAEEFQRQLGIGAGETTPDREFTLETVNCLGACALGPIVVADGQYLSNVSAAQVRQILERARVGIEQVGVSGDQQLFPLDVSCPHCEHSLMDAKHLTDGYPSIRIAAGFDRNRGWMRLSCLYGKLTARSEHEIPIGTAVDLFCPHCKANLLASANCLECGARMAQAVVRGGGRLRICSRCGCDGNMLDLDGADSVPTEANLAKPVNGISGGNA